MKKTLLFFFCTSFIVFAGCSPKDFSKDTIYIPAGGSHFPCSSIERYYKNYDISIYDDYNSLWENAPHTAEEFLINSAGDLPKWFSYNLWYLPTDFHTVSLQCLNERIPLDSYLMYWFKKREVSEFLILDFLLSLHQQNFQKSEELFNIHLQNSWTLLPFAQRKLITSRAWEKELFILSEDWDAQNLNYLIQRVFIKDFFLHIEKLYSFYVLHPSFKKIESLGEEEIKQWCKQQYIDDQEIQQNILWDNNILNPLNHYLDQEQSIFLCKEFHDFYFLSWYENMQYNKVSLFTWYEKRAKEIFDSIL